MKIITVLNKCYKFKGFVYKKACFVEPLKGKYDFFGKTKKVTKPKTKLPRGNDHEIEVKVEHRKNSKGVCPSCSKACVGYDKLPERRYEFIPLWGFPVFFLYSRRRINCREHGIAAEKLPWSKGKNQLTDAYMQFLAHWAKKLSWLEVARSFNTSWEKVFKSVECIVNWGLQNRDLEGVTAIGVDEVLWHRGHKYLTLVYQINSDCTRLLWIGKDRTEKTFQNFFDFFGKEKIGFLEYICSDMWKPYLNMIKKNADQAIHILDRFHIVARLNKALDKVRAEEHRQLKEDGFEAVLTKSRWLLLKNPENLTEYQDLKLKDLLKYNLKSMRAYLLKEEFQLLWNYTSPYWAEKFIDRWIAKTMRSKIEPLKKESQTIKRHKSLILNWFKAKKSFSSGIVEGLNTKVKLTVRKSYGFRTYKCTEIALYHSLGKLPEPPLTHKFY